MSRTRGSYIVDVKVEHYPRHCEDFAEHMAHSSGKLVDTGDPKQMVADTLRSWAADIAPDHGEALPEADIYAAFDRVRGRLMQGSFGPSTRDLVLGELNAVVGELGLEWYGVIGPPRV